MPGIIFTPYSNMYLSPVFFNYDPLLQIFQLGSGLQPQVTSKEAGSNGKPYQNFRNNNDELNLSRDLFLSAVFSPKRPPWR